MVMGKAELIAFRDSQWQGTWWVPVPGLWLLSTCVCNEVAGVGRRLQPEWLLLGSWGSYGSLCSPFQTSSVFTVLSTLPSPLSAFGEHCEGHHQPSYELHLRGITVPNPSTFCPSKQTYTSLNGYFILETIVLPGL